jgi:hypothetical protein
MSARYLTGTTDEFAGQKMNSRTKIQTAADAHAIRAIHQRMIEASRGDVYGQFLPLQSPFSRAIDRSGWATNACMRLLSGNGARCRTHDPPASGLCHTPQPAVPRHIL